MDFKLILLLVGMGLLLMVMLYALWGFLGGFKRELKCTAVLLILLLLGWLIYSDPAVMMGANIPSFITSLLSSLGVEGEAASTWEVIVQVLQNLVPNGHALFVEGREAYELAYDLVAGVLRGVGLIAITVTMISLSAVIRFVSHIVKLIVSAVKKAKAKKAPAAEVQEVEAADEDPEQVVVLKGIEGADDVLVSVNEKEYTPKPITQRIWGAVTGLIKACVVICIMFVPLSGVVSILDSTSEDTRELVSDLIAGEVQFTEGTEEENGPVEIVYDFVEDYKKSPLGIIVESSSYFFGDSFSTLLFDATFNFTTDSQKIYLREELVTFIEAVNALEGNVDYKNLEQAKLEAALDELKDSKLLPEVMPVAIEYAYETEALREMLVKANQEAAFLQLRYINWDKDLEALLDAVKVVYTLDIFAEDFNALTLDPGKVREVVKILNKTELLPNALPLGVQVAIKLDAVQDLINDPKFKPTLTNVDWDKELLILVDVYEEFQKLGITKFEGDVLDLVLDAIFVQNNEVVAKAIFSDLVHMDLFTSVLTPVVERVLDSKFAELNEGQFKSLVGVLPIEELSASEWESDLHVLVDLADKFYDLGVFGFELANMDLTSEKAIQALKDAIDMTFGTLGSETQEAKYGLNLLRKEDALVKVIDWAFKNFDLVSLDAELNLGVVSLPKEGGALKQLIDVYAALVAYPEFDLVGGKIDLVALLQKEEFGEIVVSALEALVESDIVLNSLAHIIDHKVSPFAEKYEAKDILDSVLSNLESEELIEEVKLLVEAVFSARDLGLLAVPGNGLKAIDFSKTEEMKVLVNALCDSKIIDGLEARILKVVLKIAKIEVELSLLEVDYDSEQELLNAFIDTLAPVLKDPDFKVFDEENKLVINPEYLLKQENIQVIIDAVQVILGDYGQDPVTTGSALVTNLISPLYEQVLKDKIPADYAELVESLKLEEFTSEELANDVRILAYVADQLVEFGIFELPYGGAVQFASNFAEAQSENILRAIANINILEKHPGEILAWAVNFAVSKYNATAAKPIEMDELTAADFAHVVWSKEVNLVVNAFQELIQVLNDNNYTQSGQIEAFIVNKVYLTEDFLTIKNGNELLDIVENLVQLQIIAPIVKAADDFIYSTLLEKGLSLYSLLDVTNEEFTEDLVTVVNVVRKVVDLGALEYVYNKDISYIDYAAIAGILYDENGADITDLNILQKHYAQIISEIGLFAIKQLAQNQDFTITPAKLAQEIANIDIQNDAQKVANIIVTLGAAIQDLDAYSLSEVLELTKIYKSVNDIVSDPDIIRNENVERVFSVLADVSEMTFVEAVGARGFNALINRALINIDPVFAEFRDSLTGAELVEDLAALSTLSEGIIANDVVYLILGDEVWNGDEALLAEMITTVLGLNVINNNNETIVRYAAEKVASLIPLAGLEFEIPEDAFAHYKDSTWAADQKLLAETIARAAAIAFQDLGLNSVAKFQAFVNDKEYANYDIYTPELVEKLGGLVANIISLETVNTLLPPFITLGIESLESLEINGKKVDLDLHHLEIALNNEVITKEMLAQDVVTLFEMAALAISEGALDLVKDLNNAELDLAGYADVVAKIGELNVLAYNATHSAKTSAALVNAVASVAGIDFRVDELAFDTLSRKDWLADSAKLGEIIVAVDAILESLELNTIAEIKAFNFKDYQSYVNDANIDLVVDLAQLAFEFNAGKELITLAADYALPRVADRLHTKPQLVHVEFDFLLGTISNETLHNDVAVLGEIAKEALSLGVFEYLNTKDIKNLELSHVANIVDQLAELNLYTQTREDWYLLAAQIASDATGSHFRLEADDFANVDFEQDNQDLQDLIINLDELFKANEHYALSEVINFVTNLGVTYQQWATDENAERVVEIVDNVADIDFLMVFAVSSVDFVVLKALENEIDIRFLYDQPYEGAHLSEDIHSIADILEEALDFGLVELVWEKELQKIDLTHIQEIIRIVGHLNIFELAQPEWVSLIANVAGSKLGLPLEVTAENFAHIDWELENKTAVDLVGKFADILAENKFESTIECKEFIKQQAYLSNQYITEENIELIAQVLDVLANLDVLEQLLPGLALFGTQKLGVELQGDFTQVTGADFATISYMIREAAAFGAVEIYNNILWGEKYFYEGDFDLSHVKNIVNAVARLGVLRVDVAGWAYFAASQVDSTLTLEEMQAIDYGADRLKVIEIIELAEKLMKQTHLTNLVDIFNWIEQQGYLSAQYINDENVYTVAEILQAVSEIKVLVPFANTAFSAAISRVPQFSYLVGNLTNEDVMNDLSGIATVIKELVLFGTIDLYYYGTCEEFKFEHVHNAVEALISLNIVNADRAELSAYVFNLLAKALNINAEYTANDFASADWEKENEVLLGIVDKVAQLAKEMNVDNTAQLKQYIHGKHYLLAQYTNEITLRYAVDLLELVASIEVLDVIADEFAAYGLDKVNGLDISFLISGINKGEITGQELVADLHTLTDLLYDLLDYNLYDALYSNNYVNLNTEEFVEIFVQIDNMNVLNTYREDWTLLIVNKLFGKFLPLTEADLNNITDEMWEDEIYDLAHTVVAVYEYLVARGYANNAEILRLYNEVVKEKKYNSKRYLVNTFVYGEDGRSQVVAKALANIVNVAANSDVAAILLHDGLTLALDKVADKGYDLTLLPQYVSVADLQADVPLLTEAVVELVMFGAIDLAADKGEIEYENIDRLNRAIDLLLNTNLLNADSAYVLETILKDPGAYADAFELRDSSKDIQAIVSDLAYILSAQEIETLEQALGIVKDPKSFKFIYNNTINAQLNAVAEVLDVFGNNEVLTQAVLSGARGYLGQQLDKYAGIADIYNIYDTVTLGEDLTSVANALFALEELDVYAISQSSIVIPYNRVDVVSTVLNELLGLHYLTDENRTQEIVHAVGLIVGADLTDLETMELDLVGDAAKLVEAYEELLPIFNHAKYPYIYVKDLKGAKIDASFVFGKTFINAAKAAFADFSSTTLYEETNGAILIVALPVVKYVLPEYYEALNIKNCSIEQLINDGEILVQIIDTVRASNIPNALMDQSVSLDFAVEKENIEFVAEKLFELRMLDGSFNKLAALVLRDFVYGKTINGTYIPTDSFNVENITIYNDLVIVSKVADLAVQILTNEGVNSISSAKGLMNKAGIVDLLMNNDNLLAIADILDLLAETSVLQDNAYALWRYFALPVVEAQNLDKYVSYIAASNEELLADMTSVAEIARLLVGLEVADIYNGAVINYDQADEVEELLVLVSQLNYLTYHKEQISDLIDAKVSGLGFYGMSSEDIDLAAELLQLAEIYHTILPVLVNSEYPFTTLNQYKYMLRNKAITDKAELTAVLVEELNAILDTYDELLELELFKYVLVTVTDMLPDNSITSLLDFSVLSLEELESDLNSVSVVLRNAVAAGILPEVVEKDGVSKLTVSIDLATDDEDEVATIIETLTSMHLVNAKFADIMELLDSKVSAVDFSLIDFRTVDIAEDGKELAGLAKELIVICNRTDSFKLSIEQLGDKILWLTIADVYAELINIETTNLILESLADKYLGKYIPAGETQAVLTDISDALYAAYNLGIFSNDGVNLSNAAKVSALADALRNTLELPKAVLFALKYIEDRGSYYDVIPLSYDVADDKAEMAAIKELIKAASEFAKEHASKLSSKDYAGLVSAETEADVKELLTKAYDSEIIARIAGTITGGTFRALTRADSTRFDEYNSFGLAEMLGGVEAAYHIADLVVELGILDKTIHLTKTAEMKELITFITTGEYTEFYCDLLFGFALSKLGFDKNKVDLTTINYPAEALVFCKVIDDMTPALNVSGLNIKDFGTFKNSEFVSLAADGLVGLKDSALFAAYIRDVELLAINKAGYSNSVVQLVKDRLNDETYLDSQILADWPVALAMVKEAVKLGVLDGSVALDKPETMKNVLTNAFALVLFENYEESFVRSMLGYVNFIDANSIDFAGINWATEEVLFTEFIYQASNLLASIGDFSSMNADKLHDTSVQTKVVKFVEAAANSEIGRQVFPTIYSSYVEPALPADYKEFIDFSDPNYTHDKWANDFEKLFEAYNKLEELGYGETSFDPTFEDVLAIYDLVFGASGIYATSSNPAHWMDHLVYSNLPTMGAFAAKPEAVTDWDNEVIAIRAILQNCADHAGLTTKVHDFNTKEIYETTDWVDLEHTLESIRNSESMHTLLVAVINDAINNNSDSTDPFYLAEYKSAAFNAQIVGGQIVYDAAYWTDAELEVLAKLVATFEAKYVGTHVTVEITNTAAYGDLTTDYKAHYHVDAGVGVVDVTEVGYYHVLALMAESKTFEVTNLKALIENELEDVFGTITIGNIATPADVKDVFTTLNNVVAQNANLFDGNAEKLLTIIDSDSAQLVSIIEALNASTVLKPLAPAALAKVIEDGASKASVASSSIYAAMDQKYADDINSREDGLTESVQDMVNVIAPLV